MEEELRKEEQEETYDFDRNRPDYRRKVIKDYLKRRTKTEFDQDQP